MPSIELLIVEEDRESLHQLEQRLREEGYGATTCSNKTEAMQKIEEHEYDVVLIDLEQESIDEFALLRRIKETHPQTEVIIIAASASVEIAVEAIKEGAFHYLPKPYRLDEVLFLVKNAVEKRILRLELLELRELVNNKQYLNELIGKSPRIQELKKEITRVAPLDCTVLIRGETGTGKEMVARIIHRMSNRADRNFFAVNCGTLNAELLSNELFGHEKEAFTGAQREKKGLFEASSGGTILLDEIGDMPLNMQVQLLRVLQEKTVIRVGGTREVPVDIRILAATNRSLKEEIARGTFREDLYYRLNVFTLRIPPLRQRKDDIPLFCRYFVDKFARRFQKEVGGISRDVLNRFREYHFPGNVRELENVIERAVVLADGPMIHLEHLPRRLQQKSKAKVQESDNPLASLDEMEKRHIQKVLAFTGNNKSRAAEILNISRVSLWRKIKAYDLERSGRQPLPD
ncbi:MAG: sigma-54 dependent transcriptional regulator [Desulfohalobiaceae bacterium]|nr:sigma-54 dependent transcriptional regulator [Desulfohalobiaceae bacterium]